MSEVIKSKHLNSGVSICSCNMKGVSRNWDSYTLTLVENLYHQFLNREVSQPLALPDSIRVKYLQRHLSLEPANRGRAMVMTFPVSCRKPRLS